MRRAGVLHRWEGNLWQNSFQPSRIASVTRQSRDMPHMEYKTEARLWRHTMFAEFEVQDLFVKSHEMLIFSTFKNGEDMRSVSLLPELFVVPWSLFLAITGYDVPWLKPLKSHAHHMQCRRCHGNTGMSHLKVRIPRGSRYVNRVDMSHLRENWQWQCQWLIIDCFPCMGAHAHACASSYIDWHDVIFTFVTVTMLKSYLIKNYNICIFFS